MPHICTDFKAILFEILPPVGFWVVEFILLCCAIAGTDNLARGGRLIGEWLMGCLQVGNWIIEQVL